MIVTLVQPAFRKLGDFIKEVYLGRTREYVGVWNLPNGPEFYQQCLKFHTSTNLTAGEIHEMGIQEVKRIEQEMKQVERRNNATFNQSGLNLNVIS